MREYAEILKGPMRENAEILKGFMWEYAEILKETNQTINVIFGHLARFCLVIWLVVIRCFRLSTFG